MAREVTPSLRERVAGGEFVFGTLLLDLRAPTLPLVLAQAGFDFFVLDMEHGSHDVSTAADLFASARLAGITPLVRPPSHADEHFKRLLGLGAAGVMVPNVETAEQAAQVVRAARYPPDGTRGLSGNSAQVDFESLNLADMTRRASETTFVMLQIESALGVSNANAILSTEGVDAVLVGPGDLSLNLGLPGQYDHPDFIGTVQTVFDTARKHGLAPGIHCSDEAFARRWHAAGAGLLTYSSDTGFLAAGAARAASLLGGLREESG